MILEYVFHQLIMPAWLLWYYS